MSDQNMDRYLELFLEESTEQIDLLNDGLLRLEKEGAQNDIVEDIFRSAHTLKSAAAFVGQNAMSELAHRMEDLLQQVREDKLRIEIGLVNLLFRIVDRVRNSLVQIANGDKMNDDYKDLKKEIESYHGAAPANESFPANLNEEKSSELSMPVTENASEEIYQKSDSSINESEASAQIKPEQESENSGLIKLSEQSIAELARVYNGRNVFSCSVKIDPDAPMKNMKFLLLSENLSRAYEIFTSVPDAIEFEGSTIYDEYKFILIGDCSKDDIQKECQIDLVVDIIIEEYTKHNTELQTTSLNRSDEVTHSDSKIQTKNIKVSSDKIDYLMNNVGELVIVNSGLQNVYDDLQQSFGDTTFLSELKGKIDQSERIVRDLQSGIMKTRMIPVGVVFNRFARPVRDLANRLGKQVELKFSGEDTELDKNIIDVLGEPLLHIMRNSLDHGIELPDERVQAGKPGTGTLSLQSYQSGNNVFIEIRDDGKGLNRDAIFESAVKKGLVQADQEMTDEEIYHLIFHPGFSTSSEITDVSGRGVGMGVVKKLMDDFKGTVQIENDPGQSCSILMSFPLTLAIVSAVIVRLGSEEYAFPLADVVETIHISKEEITSLQGRQIINLRGDILSIFDLSRLMGLQDQTTESPETIQTGDDPDDKDEIIELPVVVVNSANRKVGFIVSGFSGKMEIVIKSLEQNFKSVAGLIGACLLGDGRIVMVVDVHSLLDTAYEKTREPVSSSQIEYLQAVTKYNEFVISQRHQSRDTTDSVEGVLRKKLKNMEDSVSGIADESDEIHIDEQASLPVAASLPDDPGSRIDADSTKPHDSSVAMATADKTSVESPQELIMDVSSDTIQADDQAVPVTNQNSFKDAFEEISPNDFQKLQEVVKRGMNNSGDVLTQLLGVQVRVSVPEFKTIQFEQLARQNKGKCYAIQLPIEGDMQGMNLLIFDSHSGIQAAGELMGLSAQEVTKLPLEDIESVLCELANIVGSSILNEFSNSTDLSVMPCPPEFYFGEYEDIIKKIKNSTTYQEEMQILYIMTDFFRDDVEFFGRLYVIPTTKSLARVLNHLD